MASASDNFNRSNETPIAPPWTLQAGNEANLVSNAFQGTSSGETFYYYDGAATTADQYSEADGTNVPSNDWGPAARIDGAGAGLSTPEGYWAGLWSNGLALNKLVGGSFTELTSRTGSVSNGDVARIEVEGTALRGYLEAVQVASTTDSSLTGAGQGVGIFVFEGDAGAIDNWSGGDLGGGGSGQTVNPGHLASTAQLFAPTLVPQPVTITPGHVASAAQLFAPTIAPGPVVITPGHIASTAQLFTPSASGVLTITPARIDSAEQHFAPTTAPGPVTITPARIDSAEQHFAPTIVPGTVVLTPGHIGSTVQYFAPSLAVGVVMLTPARVGPETVMYTPAVIGGEVSDDLPNEMGKRRSVRQPTIYTSGRRL